MIIPVTIVDSYGRTSVNLFTTHQRSNVQDVRKCVSQG